MPRPRPASYRLGQPDLVLVVISLEPAGVEKARSYSTQHLGGASTRMRTQVQPGLSRGLEGLAYSLVADPVKDMVDLGNPPPRFEGGNVGGR